MIRFDSLIKSRFELSIGRKKNAFMVILELLTKNQDVMITKAEQ